jgi:hypothetical protein
MTATDSPGILAASIILGISLAITAVRFSSSGAFVQNCDNSTKKMRAKTGNIERSFRRIFIMPSLGYTSDDRHLHTDNSSKASSHLDYPGSYCRDVKTMVGVSISPGF